MVKPIHYNPLWEAVGPSGPITDLVSFPRSPIDFRFHVVTARLHESFESCLAESVARCVASGVSDDPRIARVAAIGEAWERIAFVNTVKQLRETPLSPCPCRVTADDIFGLPFLLERDTNRRTWSHDSLSSSVNIRRYLEYSAGQPPLEREIPATILVPGAQSTLFETTNGLSCAESFEVALDRAVREVVERDALMLVWLTRSGGRRVAPDPFLSPDYGEQIERMTNLGIKTIVRDISTDLGIRVFLVAITASFPGNRIGIAFGAGAHRASTQAASHAFREACLSWRGVAWRTLTGDNPANGNPPSSFAAHGEYYSSWDRMHWLDFLVGDDPIENIGEVSADVPDASCDQGHVELLLQKGRKVLVTELTPAQAADAGLTVVQAVIPGLVPLYIGDRAADELAWNRLPTTIGGIAQPKPDELNPGFHPWP